jgi:uncharacterized YigZ family protein
MTAMRELLEKNVLEQDVKKSRFIASALPASTPEEATALISELSVPEATHNCWAYKIGNQYRFSDDGEPGGTAGRPILAAIEKQQVDRCLVLVTRFFGGIKLGAGGLARAYGGVAAECLRCASSREIRTFVNLSLTVPFECIGDVYALLKPHRAEKQSERFEPCGAVLSVLVETADATAFEAALTNVTRGRAEIERSEPDEPKAFR